MVGRQVGSQRTWGAGVWRVSPKGQREEVKPGRLLQLPALPAVMLEQDRVSKWGRLKEVPPGMLEDHAQLIAV